MDGLTPEEEQYIEEVIVFNNAGIKVCVLHGAEPDVCEGEVFTIGKPIDQGPMAGKKLRMNICEAHFSDGDGWDIIDDENE